MLLAVLHFLMQQRLMKAAGQAGGLVRVITGLLLLPLLLLRGDREEPRVCCWEESSVCAVFREAGKTLQGHLSLQQLLLRVLQLLTA